MKLYIDDSQEFERFQVFKKNLVNIDYLNENDQGSAVYGTTEFSDMTPEEFSAVYLTLKPRDVDGAKEMPKPFNRVLPTTPDSFDWRDHGAVTAVKNQG